MIGKFGAVFASIPAPMSAALYCVLFAYVGTLLYQPLICVHFCYIYFRTATMFLSLDMFLQFVPVFYHILFLTHHPTSLG